MPTETLAARVTRLEKAVAKLASSQKPRGKSPAPLQSVKSLHQPGRDDWKKVVGMFDGDKDMERIIERGAAVRRAERRKARRG